MATRCLIVDDSAHFLRAARSLLEREGMNVVGVAMSGAEAMTRIGELTPDVVLVDIDLGGESGFDLARTVRERTVALNGQGRPLPIIMISSHAGEDYQDLIEDSPAVGFLGKSMLSAGAIRSLL
ncbi:MAG: response regulator [Actinocatenispora sp.]